MPNYDDVVERRRGERSVEDNPAPQPKPPQPPAPDINLMDLLNEDGGIGGFASQLNPDLKSKVLVPLANVLDKYGVSNSVAGSPQAQNTLGLVSLLTDIAPVVKGLADYISGQQNKLAAEDKAFLDEIRKAQESGEMSDLFGGEDVMNIGEGVEDEAVETSASSNEHPIFGEMGAVQYNPDGTVNWTASIDPDGSLREKNRKMALGITPEYEAQMESMNLMGGEKLQLENVNNEIMSMPSLEELAMSAGLTMEKVHEASSEIRDDKPAIAPTPITPTPVQDLLSGDVVNDIMAETSFDEEIVYLTDEEVESLEREGIKMEMMDAEDSMDEGHMEIQYEPLEKEEIQMESSENESEEE